MINETGNTENTDFADEANRTLNGSQEGRTSKVGQVKELGKKGLEPLVEVFSNHKGDFSPYLDALTKALKSGATSLQEGSEAEKFIGGYFTQGADFLSQWKDKLGTKSPKEFLEFLEVEGKNHPAVLFGVSYFGGMLLGRFGRHLGKTMRSSTENIH
jgi:hypothetical protein